MAIDKPLAVIGMIIAAIHVADAGIPEEEGRRSMGMRASVPSAQSN
jgi:hypothetical protein